MRKKNKLLELEIERLKKKFKKPGRIIGFAPKLYPKIKSPSSKKGL
jgi:hypothetical protein